MIIEEVRIKRNNQMNIENNEEINAGSIREDNSKLQTISLPWVPKLSPKLRKIYKKAGYKVVFKSYNNLQQILTSKNKTKLPKNSYPGIYKIKCTDHPDNPYVGETKMQIQTRNSQHKKDVSNERCEKSAVSFHKKHCNGDILWKETETIKVEKNKFDRKVREALEIQYNECGPEKGGMNLDHGKYVTTKFWTPFFAHKRRTDKRNSKIGDIKNVNN